MSRKWFLALAATTALLVCSRPMTAVAAEEPTKPVSQADLDELKKDLASTKTAADSAWMLVSTALVMFMVPGLALFYGGMVRRKNVLAHHDAEHGRPGRRRRFLDRVRLLPWRSAIPGAGRLASAGTTSSSACTGVQPTTTCCRARTSRSTCTCMYQGMFAIITPALISGAIAERIRFGPYCLFLILWVDAGLLPAGPLGLGDGLVDTADPANAGTGRSAGSARWARSTSPAAPWSTSRPAYRAWRRSWCCASASAIPNTPCTPTAWC